MSSRRKENPEEMKVLRDTASLILAGLKEVQTDEHRTGYLALAIRSQVELAESKYDQLFVELQELLELVKVSLRPMPRVPPGFMDSLRIAAAETAAILLVKVNKIIDG
jgi:hypothetical protein